MELTAPAVNEDAVPVSPEPEPLNVAAVTVPDADTDPVVTVYALIFAYKVA